MHLRLEVLKITTLRLYLISLLLVTCNLKAAEFTLSHAAAQVVPIRISENADQQVQRAAQDLSTYLEKFFGKPFPIQSSKGSEGIILGTTQEFPDYAPSLKLEGLGAKEGYLIRSNKKGVLLIGNSPLGAQNAVWDFLHHIGYRHFFPGAKWEIIPHLHNVKLNIDEVSQPSYATRKISIGYGMWPDRAKLYQEWLEHNREQSGFSLDSGHAYEGIYKRNKAEFEKHPEYLSEGGKFIVANEALRGLVVQDILNRLEKNSTVDSISVEPSDGGGWPKESSLGSVSNQAVTLANQVAAAVREKYPGKKIGMYAYNQHSPPPSILVDKDVIVSVATGFISGGVSVEALMDGWHKQGATVGARDYLGVISWSHDLPGRSKASDPEGIAKKIAEYYQLGARYYTAESNDSWVPDGLGFYVVSRCLWNVQESKNVPAIKDDFLSKAFGSAKPAMQRFYGLIDGASGPLLSDNLLAGMYRALADAYTQTKDAAVTARIDDFVAYTHFIELYNNYTNSDTKNRQSTFEALVAYGEKIRPLGVVHTLALYRDTPVRDKAIKFTLNDVKKFASGPLTASELQGFVSEGVAKYKLLAFKPKSFSQNLVPLVLNQKNNSGDMTVSIRQNANIFYTYCEKPGEEITFVVKGGQIYNGKYGPVKIELFPLNQPYGESVAKIEVPADKVEHEVKVKTEYAGLQRLEIKDGGDATSIRWPSSRTLAITSGQESHSFLFGYYTMYFYVPKNTTQVGGYASNPAGKMITANGKEIFAFSSMKGPGFFDVPVPLGEDGKVWKLEHCGGAIFMMTTPAYLSPSPDSLLIPEEVLKNEKKDSKSFSKK
ncbi:MAG: DUF4838 domain-containing protein [Chthoniobacterales bacterium]